MGFYISSKSKPQIHPPPFQITTLFSSRPEPAPGFFMKELAACLLILTLVIGLFAGCVSNPDRGLATPSPEPVKPTTTLNETPPPVATVSQKETKQVNGVGSFLPEEKQQEIIQHARQKLEKYRPVAGTIQPELKGGVILWRYDGLEYHNAAEKIPEDLIAKTNDDNYTVFIITKVTEESLGTWTNKETGKMIGQVYYPPTRDVNSPKYPGIINISTIQVYYWPDDVLGDTYTIHGVGPNKEEPVTNLLNGKIYGDDGIRGWLQHLDDLRKNSNLDRTFKSDVYYGRVNGTLPAVPLHPE